MPLVDWTSEATWGAAYTDYTAHSRSLGFLDQTARLINFLEGRGLLSTHRVLIIGSALGLEVKAFRFASRHPSINTDYPNTWGVEFPGSWADTNYTAQGDAEEPRSRAIFHDGLVINAGPLRTKLTNTTGGDTFNVIITADIAGSYNNADLATLANRLEGRIIGSDFSRIVHLVSDLLPGDVRRSADPTNGNIIDNVASLAAMRWLSLDDWAALRPAHTWIGIRSQRVIVGA